MARYIPQGKEVFIDIDFFKKGLQVLDDQSKADVGSFSIMSNTELTDRGGIGPRKGMKIIGDEYTGTSKNKSCYNFKKAHGNEELLIKNLGTQTLAHSNKNKSLGWFVIKDGNTNDKEWGYTASLVNDNNQDYLIGGNKFDDYATWTGEYTTLTSALTGTETTIPVTSILKEEVFMSATATGGSTTTIVVSGSNWATNQYKDMFVYVTSGTYTGEVRKITTNTTDTLTISAVGGSISGETFQIHLLKFKVGDSIKIGSTDHVISALDKYNEITISTAHSETVSSGTVIPSAFKTYSGLPKGNRFTNWLTRIFVGAVRSAEALGSGGTKQGYSSGGSAFVSELYNPTSFDYSAPRVAGEGDIISAPYGGGDITDIKHFEKQAYLFKEDYIEAIDYSQDGNDLVVREPLKVNVGSVGKVIVGSDDIYFMTKDNAFTSIGRAANKDLKPQTSNLGYGIKRLLDKYDFSEVAGIEYKDKIYISFKESSDDADNNRTIVYNKQHRSFEGIWSIGFVGFTAWDGKLVGAESTSGDFHELNVGIDDNGNKIHSLVQTNFFNLVSSKNNQQAANGWFFEGYVDDFTDVDIQLYRDFETTPFLDFTFNPSIDSADEDFTTTVINGTYLGNNPIGLYPMGVLENTIDDEGRRRFYFRIYFPFTYGRYYSFGWNSSGKMSYEFIRIGPSLKEEYNISNSGIKSIT